MRGCVKRGLSKQTGHGMMRVVVETRLWSRVHHCGLALSCAPAPLRVMPLARQRFDLSKSCLAITAPSCCSPDQARATAQTRPTMNAIRFYNLQGPHRHANPFPSPYPSPFH